MSNKRNKLLKIIGVLSLCLITSTSLVDAHSGRTDANGGHRDNKNKSGLGSYHYHHGYGPHLHTNGCPYTTGTTSSSGGSSSSSSSSVDREEQRRKSEEREQEEVRSKGYNVGYNDGYSGNMSDSYYSGNYSDLYEERYDEGYLEGKEKLENEKEALTKKGYELGLTGSEIDLTIYNNEELKMAYKNGYDQGIIEYKNNKIQEYRDLGLEDGKADKQNEDIQNIDEEFKLEYEQYYNQGQEILAKTYRDKGYDYAFKSTQYKSQGYKSDKYNNWYKEGFDKGIKDIEYVKEVGYNDGYSRNENNVPEGLEHTEDIYSQYYTKGQEVADKEAKEGRNIITGFASIGWLLRRYLVAKKSIM